MIGLSRVLRAGWQSGYAAACKAVDAGSIPTPASKRWTVFCVSKVRPGGEIGRRTGLKIPGPLKACRFDSGPGHHFNIPLYPSVFNRYFYIL